MVCGAALRVRAAAGLPDCARMVCRHTGSSGFGTDHSVRSILLDDRKEIVMTCPSRRRTDLAISLSHLLEALEHDHPAYRSVTLFGSIAPVDDGANGRLLVTGLMENTRNPTGTARRISCRTSS